MVPGGKSYIASQRQMHTIFRLCIAGGYLHSPPLAAPRRASPGVGRESCHTTRTSGCTGLPRESLLSSLPSPPTSCAQEKWKCVSTVPLNEEFSISHCQPGWALVDRTVPAMRYRSKWLWRHCGGDMRRLAHN